MEVYLYALKLKKSILQSLSILQVMASQLQDNLENLRLRATCSICTELYTKPKKLPNCCHVFCLMCIKRYIQTKLPNNFPPCPMCRKPITKMLKEVDFLEPARAEEDIIDFVRPFENCDLCKKRERPSTKCLECSSLICENCEPVHSKLQPLHSVISIFETNVINQLQIKHECKTHKDQSLDLYCLMCNRILCIYCDKYSHESCRSTYDDVSKFLNALRNITNLLKQFIMSTDDRKNSIRELERTEALKRFPPPVRPEPVGVPAQTLAILRRFPGHMLTASPNMPSPSMNIQKSNVSTPVVLRVVQLKEFSSFVRHYLISLKDELNSELEIYKEHIEHFDTLVKDSDTYGMFKERINSAKASVSHIHKQGSTIISDVGFLIGKASDVEVAESALNTEKTCAQFYRLGKTYSLENRTKCLKTVHFNGEKSLLKQVSICSVQEEEDGNMLLFVAQIELPKTAVLGSRISSEEPETHTMISEDLYCSKEISKLMLYSIKSFLVTVKDYPVCPVFNVNIEDNTLHTNDFLDKFEKHLGADNFLATKTQTIENGFVGNSFAEVIESHCLEKCSYDREASCVTVVKAGACEKLKYKTYFVSMLSAVPFIYERENICRQHDESTPPSVIGIIGARSEDSGLETLFLEADQENQGFTHGVAVCAKVARFKESFFTEGLRGSRFVFLQDKDGTFSFLKAKPCQREALITYHSKIEEIRKTRNFVHVPEDEVELQVPVTDFTTDLLCELGVGMIYVKHEKDNNNINIGRLKLTRVVKSEDIIFSLTQDNIPVPLRKLIPYTIAEGKYGDLVIVCAVEDDISHLVMILPMKQSAEILEIQYPEKEYGDISIIDLEMDCDGNVMLVVRNSTGKMWRVMTKYIMP